MRVAEALKTLARDRVAPAYLIGGEEAFWGREWLRAVQTRLQESAQTVERDSFEGKIDWPRVRERLSERGFFLSHRLVVIIDGQWPKKEESLKQVLATPIPDATLVVWEKKLSAPLAKLFGSSRTIELKPLYRAQLVDFVSREAKSRQLQLSPQAAERVADLHGQNGDQIRHELEKMWLYDAGRVWQADEVERFSRPVDAPQEIWGLTDAIMGKDRIRAAAELSRALTDGKAPVLVLVVIARLASQLLHALDARARGLSAADFGQVEKMAPFVASKLYAAAPRWRREELVQAIGRAERMDRALKSGHGEAADWLTLWVAELTWK